MSTACNRTGVQIQKRDFTHIKAHMCLDIKCIVTIRYDCCSFANVDRIEAVNKRPTSTGSVTSDDEESESDESGKAGTWIIRVLI